MHTAFTPSQHLHAAAALLSPKQNNIVYLYFFDASWENA
jgi:hypothetical protein